MKYCEWVIDREFDTEVIYSTGCEGRLMKRWNFKYCPYCGKQIKESTNINREEESNE